MITHDSPFRRIPKNLDRKQAFFIDGIRHAAEICELSYNRLTLGLYALSQKAADSVPEPTFAQYFLDAWAFVDAADRLRCLWAMQPNAESLPSPVDPTTLRAALEDVRAVRNVSDHIAQKADQAVSLNAPALAMLAWVSLISESPIRAKTCVIRPGFAQGSVKTHFPFPAAGTYAMVNHCTEVRIHAGKEVANLTKARETLVSVVEYAEETLRLEFAKPIYRDACQGDMLATAELDFRATRTQPT